MRLIARNSSFIYKDKAVHLKEVAEELGVSPAKRKATITPLHRTYKKSPPGHGAAPVRHSTVRLSAVQAANSAKRL
jgi:hypothetical protein